MKFSFPGFAIKRPITTIMVILTLGAFGLIGVTRLPLEFLPAMDIPFIMAIIPYPGATPEQVENEIAIPAEGEFRTLSHIRRIQTTSDTDGCQVRIEFDWETDMNLAAAEVRDRIERLRLQLPSDADTIMLQRFSAEAMPVMAFSLFSPEDDEAFAHRLRTNIEPRLKRIEGVADVMLHAPGQREVFVEFDQDALRRANLGLYEVVEQLQESSVNLSLGALTDGGTRYYARASNEWSTVEELENLVIGPNNMRLRSVADVRYRPEERESVQAIDGQRGAFVLIQKEAEANTVDVCQGVQEELEQIQTEPEYEAMEVFEFFDQSDIILSALDGLVDAGRYGGMLAFAVLFLFMLRIRPTLLVALAIPASLLGGLLFMFFAGMTLNLITMISLITAVGMLVDNSIVVMENIFRRRQLGEDPITSAREGASEVGLAITSATCTTVVVFIPVLYMQTGEMASYMRQFAAPVIASLFTSLLLALTVIPLAASRMRDRDQWGGYHHVRGFLSALARRPGFVHIQHWRPIKRLITMYSTALAGALRWRLATMAGLGAIALLTAAIPYHGVGVEEIDQRLAQEVRVRVELDQNHDLEMAGEVFERLEAAIDRQRDELGIRNVFMDYSRSGGNISVYLKSPEDYPQGEEPPYTPEDVMNILWQRMPEKLPGVELRFRIPEMEEDGGDTVSVRLRGHDTQRLENYAKRFRDLMDDLPHITDAETDTDRSRDEVQVRMDKPRVAEANITPMVIAQTVDFALRGARLPYLKQDGREIRVTAQFREEDRQTRRDLDNVSLAKPDGSLTPISQLVDYQRGQSPRAIRRVNGQNVVNVTGQVSGDNTLAVHRDVRELVEAFQMPQGYSVQLGDEFQEMDANITSFLLALVFAIILIYIVMATLFESPLLPLSVLTSVPLAFLGVFWALYLTNTSWDIVAFIGAILMVGIIVNNGIVIVDYINRLRLGGLDRHSAILQAGRDRFRPVFMTALTTILGCVPLALGRGVGDAVSFHSLGRALIGGLTTGTILTLFIVPLFYTFIDDIRLWVRDFAGALASIGSSRR
ncbi:MAG: efflux RND transporter permease subunit [Candidatus Hydrogenedentota bacterium]